jgi:DNA modification methylase
MKHLCAHTALVELHKLQPNPLNPNKHPDRQIELLAKIIDYQGQRAPIVVSKRSGFITKGHGRLMALRKLGWETAACDYQDYDSEAQEYADLIADNKIAELAQHDDAQMIEDLKDIDLDDFELLGMDDFNLPEDPDEAKDAIEDDIPENVDTRSKPGDLWVLGEHRLLCGDSTNIQHVERLMGGEKADMVFTDPPYGMGLDTDYSKMAGTGKKHNVGSVDSFKEEMIQTLIGYYSYCSEVFLFGADYYIEHINNNKNGSWIIWDKRSKGDEMIGLLDNAFGSDFEMCWSKSKHQRKIARILKGNGWQTKNTDEQSVHPTQKPVALAEWFFDNWGKDKNKIADLYGGSGSTLIACEKTNRKCYMMELDPHYCDVILSRWETYSGKEAKRVDNGQTETSV